MLFENYGKFQPNLNKKLQKLNRKNFIISEFYGKEKDLRMIENGLTFLSKERKTIKKITFFKRMSVKGFPALVKINYTNIYLENTNYKIKFLIKLSFAMWKP